MNNTTAPNYDTGSKQIKDLSPEEYTERFPSGYGSIDDPPITLTSEQAREQYVSNPPLYYIVSYRFSCGGWSTIQTGKPKCLKAYYQFFYKAPNCADEHIHKKLQTMSNNNTPSDNAGPSNVEKIREASDYHKDVFGYRPTITGPGTALKAWEAADKRMNELKATKEGRDELRANGWDIEEPKPVVAEPEVQQLKPFIHKENGNLVQVEITAQYPQEGGYTLIECKTEEGELFQTTCADIYYKAVEVEEKTPLVMVKGEDGEDQPAYWNADHHIAKYIAPIIRNLAENTQAHPGSMEYEEWIVVLEKVANAFDNAAKEDNQCTDRLEETTEGLALFAHHFGHFWD